MKVLLKENVDNLGSLGDEIAVNPGYARNYLIPQGLAVVINAQNKKQVEHQYRLLEERRKAAIEAGKSITEKLAQMELVFEMAAGDGGKLFGSVTAKQILDALEQEGVQLERKQLLYTTSIKTLGKHSVPVKLHSQVAGDVSVHVRNLKADKPESTEEDAEARDNEAVASANTQE